MKILSRRDALGIGLGALALVACSSDGDASSGEGGAGTSGAGTSTSSGATGSEGGTGGDSGTGGEGGSSEVGAWTLPPTLTFQVGSAMSFDLKSTLPSGLSAGGTFAVDESGASLPSGITLSPDGVLTITDADLGDTAGVVFSYTT